MTTVSCACGTFSWQAGVTVMWSDGVQHLPEGLLCFATEELWVAV